MCPPAVILRCPELAAVDPVLGPTAGPRAPDRICWMRFAFVWDRRSFLGLGIKRARQVAFTSVGTRFRDVLWMQQGVVRNSTGKERDVLFGEG